MSLFLTDAAYQSAANAIDMIQSVTGIVSVVYIIVMLLAGVYVLRSVIQMRRAGELLPNRLIYPNYCPLDECIDPEGFYAFILPRATLLSVALLGFGAFFAVVKIVPALQILWLNLALLVIPFVLILWFGIVLRKAKKRFWARDL